MENEREYDEWQDIAPKNRIVTPSSNGWGYRSEALTEEEIENITNWCGIRNEEIRMAIFLDEKGGPSVLYTDFAGESGVAFTPQGLYRWEEKRGCGQMRRADIQTVECSAVGVRLTGKNGETLEIPGADGRICPPLLRDFLRDYAQTCKE